MDATYEQLIIRVKGEHAEELTDHIATEAVFTLLVNGENLVSLLCTPTELDAMAVGFLLSEGLLADRASLLAVGVNDKTATVSVRLQNLPAGWQKTFHQKTITSGCGRGITFSGSASVRDLPVNRRMLQISPAMIQARLSEFRTLSALYLKTGGVHSAALADQQGILLFAEDIGRHNAVDKLAGKAFLSAIPVYDKMLLSSGRVSGEIMIKAIRNRIPVLVSRAAPTCLAVTYAEDYGVTLIGFARGNRMNIYTHPQRLAFDHVTFSDPPIPGEEA